MNIKVEPPAQATPANSNDDENLGPMLIRVGEEADCVCLGFATPVGFLGFSPQEAVNLAEMMIFHARAIAMRTGQTLLVDSNPGQEKQREGH